MVQSWDKMSVGAVCALAVLLACGVVGVAEGSSECEHNQLSATLNQIATNHTHLTRLTSIGTSVQGREIWLMILSNSPEMRPLLRPQVKLIGNINGYSGPACYLLLRFIKELLLGYEKGEWLERRLLERNEIHVILNMNPDGFSRAEPDSCNLGAGRYNGRGKELNRDFPFIFEEEAREVGEGREPETEAVKGWIDHNRFLLSLSLFSGALVVSYPFDGVPLIDDEEIEGMYHATPDDDIFIHLAQTYVEQVPRTVWFCPILDRVFPGGITNGAAWEPARGTMMDYNYVKGTFELMIGVSCCRNPKDELLPPIWDLHRGALMNIILETEKGVRGVVLDADSSEAVHSAELIILEEGLPSPNQGPPLLTSAQGEFWKMIRPGKYSLTVHRAGYQSKTILLEVSLKEATKLEVKLEKLRVDLMTTAPKVNRSNLGAETTSSVHLERVERTTTDSLLFQQKEVSPVTSRNVTSTDVKVTPRLSPRLTPTFDQTLGTMLARLTSSSPRSRIPNFGFLLFLAGLLLPSLQHI